VSGEVEVQETIRELFWVAAQQLRVLSITIKKKKKNFPCRVSLATSLLCAYLYDRSLCNIDMVWSGPELIAISKERSDG